jgi:hypothetical protein
MRTFIASPVQSKEVDLQFCHRFCEVKSMEDTAEFRLKVFSVESRIPACTFTNYLS